MANLDASTLRRVTHKMVDDAVRRCVGGEPHDFSQSTRYDVLLTTGDRLPPKAVFGLALEKVIGRKATPYDFSAGWGAPCFQIIEAAGYPIVPKGQNPSDDQASWAEGSPTLKTHLTRERADLAAAKKRQFISLHGRLCCERCGLVPSEKDGPKGDACIEVHHAKIAVSKMGKGVRTRLSDLQCVCANCHRMIHFEMSHRT